MRYEGEVVLIYYNEHPGVFARLESMEADIKRGWYHVTMLLLTVPAQTVTWILREAYIDGEQFTMAGIPMRLEEVKKVLPEKIAEKQHEGKKEPNKTGTVIPFKKR